MVRSSTRAKRRWSPPKRDRPRPLLADDLQLDGAIAVMRFDYPTQLPDVVDLVAVSAADDVTAPQSGGFRGIAEHLGDEDATRDTEDVAERLILDGDERSSRHGNGSGVPPEDHHRAGRCRRELTDSRQLSQARRAVDSDIREGQTPTNRDLRRRLDDDE